MAENLENLRRTASRRFGNYEMFGGRFESDNGRSAWLMTAWESGRDPVRTYWIEGGEFFATGVRYGINFSNFTFVETFGPAPSVDPELKEAVLRAIAEWQKE